MGKQYLEKKNLKIIIFFGKFSRKKFHKGDPLVEIFFPEILPENDPKHHEKVISRKQNFEFFFPTARDFGFFRDSEDPALDCPANPKSRI